MDDAAALRLESASLRVTVTPRVGGTINAIEHTRLGASVLGTVPWDTTDLPEPGGAAADEATWLTRYSGGWPLLFPNAGDACLVDGIRHGFHGEASISPWTVTHQTAGAIQLRRRFFTVPVEMSREIALDDDVVNVRETIRMNGPSPLGVMWGHHPTFGSDLLAGDFVIETGGRRVLVDASDPSTNPLVPGEVAPWPIVPGKAEPYDLSRPSGPAAIMACLTDLAEPWAAIRRLDGTVAALLSWDGATFPFAWLWCELGGTADPPWYGRGRLIGIEPNTTWPSNGLANALRKSAPLLLLQPGKEYESWVRLHVFRPPGPIGGCDAAGRALAGTG